MRAILTYIVNPKTGEREVHVEYESSLEATGDEHEAHHAATVAALLGQSVSALRADGATVTREPPCRPAEGSEEEERQVQPQVQKQTD